MLVFMRGVPSGSTVIKAVVGTNLSNPQVNSTYPLHPLFHLLLFSSFFFFLLLLLFLTLLPLPLSGFMASTTNPARLLLFL